MKRNAFVTLKTAALILYVFQLAVPESPGRGSANAAEPAAALARVEAGIEETDRNHVLNLDGQTGCVRVPHSAALHAFTNAITIEVWFKASSFYQGDYMVNSILRKNLTANEENFHLRIRNAPSTALAEFSVGSGVGALQTPYRFQPHQWYHLAGTYDGSAITVYVNGVRIRSRALSGQMRIDPSDLFIGKGDPEYSRGEYFHGALDEIRLWNVARSAEDLRETMNVPLSGNEAGLVAYWNFDDGTAADQSSRGNDGRTSEGARFTQSLRPTASASAAEVEAAAERLASQQRQDVLEALWQSLSEIYPALEYKGIYGREWIEPTADRARRAKSDEEFYELLLELVASLNDTHTRIVAYPTQPRLEAPPVLFNEVDGEVAVIRAHADTALAPGDVILSVDGQPVRECLAARMKRVCNSTARGRIREACSQLLRGAPGTAVMVTARGADGKDRQLTLRREASQEFWREPAISSRTLESDIGYIRIARWTGSSLVADFDRALERFREFRGVIIDVRGNGGGNDQLADQVNGRLTRRAVVSSIDFWRKSGSDQYTRTIGWVRPRGPWTYRGRVAVLIDEASMSACEHFVSGVEAMGSVLLVGTPTNGAGGGPTTVSLPDGTRIRISRALGIRANGVVFEGHGIPPHIFCPPTLRDLRNGRDTALEAARDWLISDQGVPTRAQRLAEADEPTP